ncbi:MAG: DNA polymerase Y family protein [Steroidobacteraceae bacterium]
MQRVVAVDAQARTRGVQPGMGLAAALALCPELEARARDAHREQQLLRRAAALALRYSPRVSLEPPDGLLLEVRGSLALFGGAARLGERLVADCAARGLTAQLAMAPTPLAALALARTGQSLLLTGSGHFIGALSPLPLAALRWPPQALERLATMGVRTLGGALRLPRAGFARRFGRESLESLDRLTGRSAEPRRAFIARERFAARCEPAWELATHEAILRHLGPLLAELESFLRSRQAAVSVLEVCLRHRLRHEPGAPGLTRCTLRLAAPELLAERFAALLGEQLARTVLPAPVIRCELRAGELLPFAAASESLWRPGEQGGAAGRESPAFIERLRARLGADAVYGLCLVPEHRPEQAWRIAEPVLRPAGAAPAMEGRRHLRRPLWLLRRPEPLGAGPQALRLVTGPERIETGWWDGDDVARDYYVALDQDGAELWVFRERLAPHGWYLHGVFA